MAIDVKKTTKLQLVEKLQQEEIRAIQAETNNELFQERLAELELAIEDLGWLRSAIGHDYEFSRDALKRLMRLARFSFLKNPLINNAVRIQAHYVWGQGANVRADNEKINALISAFMEYPGNAREMFGHSARVMKEIELQVEGNIFVALFTNPSNGFVKVRSIIPDQIVDVITDPDDERTPWLYHRIWSQTNVDTTDGVVNNEHHEVYYPDWQYNPESRSSSYGQVPIQWDTPLYHIKSGHFGPMKFGVPEIYSALDWARAVKEDLEDYATLRRALSRFAWNLTTKGGRYGVAAAKTRLATTLDPSNQGTWETNPPPVAGSTFIASEAAKLDPIRTAGAQPSPDEGRRLWLMVSAGTGIPEVMLAGDADVGNYATSKSLDRPTELKMRNRQTLWADIYRDILSYVITQSLQSPSGYLHGMGEEVIDDFTGETIWQIAGGTDPDSDEDTVDDSIDISFPAILEHEAAARVEAIVQAATLGNPQGGNAGVMDDKTLVRLLLSALGADEIDEMLDEMYPDNFTVSVGVSEPPEPEDITVGVPPAPPEGGGEGGQEQPESIAGALREVRDDLAVVLKDMVVINEDGSRTILSEPRGVYPHRARGSRRAARATRPRRRTQGHAELEAHLNQHHKGIGTQGKSTGQLKSMHGSSHRPGTAPGHHHPEISNVGRFEIVNPGS